MEQVKKVVEKTQLEEWLEDLNSMLADAEIAALKKFAKEPKMPSCFIIGAPRSGATLMLQWLAATGAFAYPSNFIARFYNAPAVGAKIQRMLTDPKLDLNREMALTATDKHGEFFKSDLGNTFGIFAPNAFNTFWQRFFPFEETQQLTEQALTAVDAATFRAELAALESVLRKPLAMKAQIMNWHIPYLARQFPRAVFLHVKRHPFFIIQSILAARVQVFGDIKKWYSYKPSEYDELKHLSPYKQVAGQVYFTSRAVEKGLQRVDADHKIIVDYDEFCNAPHHTWKIINNKFNALGTTFHRDYLGPKQFKPSSAICVDKAEKERIVAAWYSLFGENISPKSME